MWASNEKALQEERQGHEETLHEEREARKQALQVCLLLRTVYFLETIMKPLCTV